MKLLNMYIVIKKKSVTKYLKLNAKIREMRDLET